MPNLFFSLQVPPDIGYYSNSLLLDDVSSCLIMKTGSSSDFMFYLKFIFNTCASLGWDLYPRVFS